MAAGAARRGTGASVTRGTGGNVGGGVGGRGVGVGFGVGVGVGGGVGAEGARAPRSQPAPVFGKRPVSRLATSQSASTTP